MVKKVSNIANVYSVRQKEQRGLGHAILCAKAFVGDEPFAVLLGDDVVYNPDRPAIKQLIDYFNNVQASIVGVQEVEYDSLNKYGIITPKGKLNNEGSNESCEISDMVEKPAPENAPSRFGVLGRYVLTPKIFELLETQQVGVGGEIQLTDAIKRLIAFEKVYAFKFEGRRYDVGSKIGFIEATIDFALQRDDLKDEVTNLLKKYN